MDFYSPVGISLHNMELGSQQAHVCTTVHYGSIVVLLGMALVKVNDPGGVPINVLAEDTPKVCCNNQSIVVVGGQIVIFSLLDYSLEGRDNVAAAVV